jgi:hypothetical protein
MTNTDFRHMVLGRSQAAYQCGVMKYVYNSTTPASSYVSMGIWGTNNFNMDGNGRAGFGTNTPSCILHTVGDAVRFECGNAAAQMTLKNTNSNSSTANEIYFDNTIVNSNQKAAIGLGSQARGLFFWVNGADRMSIATQTGWVGIGSVSGAGISAPLHVADSTAYNLSTAIKYYWGSSPPLGGYGGQVASGTFYVSIYGLNCIMCDVAFLVTSDERNKREICEVDGSKALDAVKKLKVKQFEFKNKKFGEGSRVGFFAQEVKHLIPEAVAEMEGEIDGVKVPDLHKMTYEPIVAVTVSALQELERTVAKQGLLIEALMKKLEMV